MRLVELAHDRLQQILCPGDICIDATAGNGHDSLFLAQLTAPNGIVYAVDS
jgi:16S rRNA C967 or C1407 C5-methylase (RsmB/RsmF family)